ncbi:hypothetical protein CPB84DRAFT_1745978 [Gymnopilus junonius]|uniref:Uncharacterized protein n=1 Tax=Gymnopilus junonius TaxID=109634 RepID=A0A9P5TQK8_GYMJU|nr:hypothetical protein CPB84DRAFT_1745978 [Gymnopilus junonius]
MVLMAPPLQYLNYKYQPWKKRENERRKEKQRPRKAKKAQTWTKNSVDAFTNLTHVNPYWVWTDIGSGPINDDVSAQEITHTLQSQHAPAEFDESPNHELLLNNEMMNTSRSTRDELASVSNLECPRTATSQTSILIGNEPFWNWSDITNQQMQQEVPPCNGYSETMPEEN